MSSTEGDDDSLFRSPNCYEKYTFIKLNEFSRMLHCTEEEKRKGMSEPDIDHAYQLS